MRRRIALLTVGFALTIVGTASAKPPMPCDYWVHGCYVPAYLCDAGVCVDRIIPGP